MAVAGLFQSFPDEEDRLSDFLALETRLSWHFFAPRGWMNSNFSVLQVHNSFENI
jgi:hypothetical protein